ncbi:MAG: peptidylprolyl isomerase [Pseudomonadota bacterium]
MKVKRKQLAIGAALLGALLGAPWSASGGDAKPAPAAAEVPVFARVNGEILTLKDYESLFMVTVRNRYYHGKVPENELEAVRREVADSLINRVLLLKESRQRGITPDQAKVRKEIEGYESRYKASPMWQQNRERLLPGLTAQLEQQSVLERLEAAVRGAVQATPEQVREYFAKNPDKFTEPEKLRLSMILLKVDPSSPKAAWEAARQEAQGIYKKLTAGGDFAELARLHSGDASAANGGALGYLHRGMVPEALQGKIDDMKPGVVVEPVTLLEGVAIMRLDERIPARPRRFEDVAERARDLAQRDLGDAAWNALIARLRAAAMIRIELPGFDKTAVSGK